VREGDAEGGEADDAEAGKQRQQERLAGPVDSVDDVSDHHDQGDLEERVDRGRADQPGEIRARRHRGAAHALEHALVPEQCEVERQRGEGRGQHAHPGHAGDEHLELVVVAGEGGGDQDQQQEREQEVEERGARVAPEQLALEAELLPGEAHASHTASASWVSSR
jgi:hypothetical protein